MVDAVLATHVLRSFNFFACNAETWTRLTELGRRYLWYEDGQRSKKLSSLLQSQDGRWDVELSMEANNTFAFNYREITPGGRLSNHACGRANDLTLS